MQVVIQTDKRYLLKILPNSKVSTSCYLVDYHNCTCAANGDTNYCTDLDFKNLTKYIKDYRFSSFSSLSAAAAVGDYHNCTFTEALLMQLLPSNNFSTALHCIEGELKKELNSGCWLAVGIIAIAPTHFIASCRNPFFINKSISIATLLINKSISIATFLINKSISMSLFNKSISMSLWLLKVSATQLVVGLRIVYQLVIEAALHLSYIAFSQPL